MILDTLEAKNAHPIASQIPNQIWMGAFAKDPVNVDKIPAADKQLNDIKREDLPNNDLQACLILLTRYRHEPVRDLLRKIHALTDVGYGALVYKVIRLGYLDLLVEIENQFPEKVMTLISENNYFAFGDASQYGHLDILKWMIAKYPDNAAAMIAGNDYEAFIFANQHGHRNVIEWLIEQYPNQALNAIRQEHHMCYLTVWELEKASDEELKKIGPRTYKEMIELKQTRPLQTHETLQNLLSDNATKKITPLREQEKNFDIAEAEMFLDIIKDLIVINTPEAIDDIIFLINIPELRSYIRKNESSDSIFQHASLWRNVNPDAFSLLFSFLNNLRKENIKELAPAAALPDAKSPLAKQGLFNVPQNNANDDTPDELTCPLTLELFNNATFCTLDGRTYEEESIRDVLTRFRRTPTNVDMKKDQNVDDVLFPNRNLQSLVDEYKKEQKKLLPNIP